LIRIFTGSVAFLRCIAAAPNQFKIALKLTIRMCTKIAVQNNPAFTHLVQGSLPKKRTKGGILLPLGMPPSVLLGKLTRHKSANSDMILQVAHSPFVPMDAFLQLSIADPTTL